ncbi:MAG: SH3 domain-containing protein [Caldilineaceae bacterium]|nr:SH3 domain-containing protein [Caldilineaceae bacterium]
MNPKVVSTQIAMEKLKNGYLLLFMLLFASMLMAGYVRGAPAKQTATATPEATVTEVPLAQRSLPIVDGWERFKVEAHGLTISYPPGWLFVEPTADDPTVLLVGTDLPSLAEALQELLPVAEERVDAGLVGLGYQLHPRESPELAAANSISIEVVPAEGANLHGRLQRIASELSQVEGIEPDRVGVVSGLRPQEEFAGSIRFRDGGGDRPSGRETIVWIVVVESADAETHLVLRFETLADEFDSLEPLLTEVVHRVRWEGQTTGVQPAPVAAAIVRTTGVRSGPGEGLPVIGWVAGGTQISLVRPDQSGDWWLAAYVPADTKQGMGSAAALAGQLGWVSAQTVTFAPGRGGLAGKGVATRQPGPAFAALRLNNPFVPPAGGMQEERAEGETAWTTFEERGRQLSIVYPQDWIFFEASKPSPADLADLSAALGRGISAADVGELIPARVGQSRTEAEEKRRGPNPTDWVGFQRAGVPDNVFVASYSSSGGLTVEQLALQIFRDIYTNPDPDFHIENAEVVSGLRPGDERVISLRYRAGEASAEKAPVGVWKVLLVSPDSQSILAFEFFIGDEEFAELEPLLREMVWRVRWEEQFWPESLAGPAVSVVRPMNVRGGPGTDHAIIGTAVAGRRFPIVAQNSAGDWWQIFYEGRLGWIYGGLVTAIGDTQEVRRADSSGWLAFDSTRHNLALSYPSGWFFFDPAQPAAAVLAALSAEVGARVDEDGIAALVSRMTGGQEEAVAGVGIQVGQRSSNYMLVLAYETGGMSLRAFAGQAAAALAGEKGIEGEGADALEEEGAPVELVTDLREGEETVIIRFGEEAGPYAGLQFWLLAPDGETLLVLATSIHGQEQSELEPVLVEMVRRLRWTELAAAQPDDAEPDDAEPAVVSLLTVDGVLTVRRGPAKIYAVMGELETGQQHPVTGRNFDGSWWQIEYEGRSGWVFGQDLAISEVESVPVAAGVPTPTPTPTATPVPRLARSIKTPEHMAYLWWEWGGDRDFAGDGREGIRELTFDFTVHNDPGDFSDEYGLYLMLCSGDIANTSFYLGLQTNAFDHPDESGGKALVFSRWETRDLANARVADSEKGWAQSSGHEGDFIGVRRAYDWGAGEYRVIIAADGADSDGEWFGVWITDKATYETTWIGSLKFPYENGRTAIRQSVYTTMEIYGGKQIEAFRIPAWHVSLRRPLGDGIESESFVSGYAGVWGELENSEVRYDRADGEVHIVAGRDTERRTPAQTAFFD